MCGKGEIQSFNAAADPIRSWYGILYFDPDLSRSSSQLPKPQATNPTRLDISQLLSLKIWRCADFCVVQKQRSTDLESVGLWKGSIGLLVQIVFFSLGQEQQKGFGNPTGFLNIVYDFFFTVLSSVPSAFHAFLLHLKTKCCLKKTQSGSLKDAFLSLIFSLNSFPKKNCAVY